MGGSFVCIVAVDGWFACYFFSPSIIDGLFSTYIFYRCIIIMFCF